MVRFLKLITLAMCLPVSLSGQANRTVLDTVDLALGTWLGPELEQVNDELPFYRLAGAVILSSGKVVIANGGMHRYHIFELATGRLLLTGGRNGEGPGEFTDMRSIVASDNRRAAIILDGRQRRLTTVSATGEVLATTLVSRVPGLYQPSLLGELSDGRLVMAQVGYPIGVEGPKRIERMPLDVWLIDPATDATERLLRTVGQEMAIASNRGGYVNVPRELGANTGIGVLPNHVVFADGDQGDVTVANPTGPTFTWATTHDKRPITTADVNAHRLRAVAGLSVHNRNAYLQLIENSPSTREWFPQLGAEVIPHGDAAFWVGRYRGPQDSWRRWDQYSVNGDLIRSMLVDPTAVLVDALDEWLVFVVNNGETEDVVIIEQDMGPTPNPEQSNSTIGIPLN